LGEGWDSRGAETERQGREQEQNYELGSSFHTHQAPSSPTICTFPEIPRFGLLAPKNHWMLAALGATPLPFIINFVL
jgi:hypothetical protein